MTIKERLNAILGRKSGNTGLLPSGQDSSSTIEALYKALPETLEWKWDDRFDCPVAAFEVAKEELMLGVLKSQLPQHWNRSTIRSAPQSVQKAIKDFGGLTPGQLAFADGLTEETMLLGLWWPWGHGATVSIRFAPYGADSSEDKVDAARTMIRQTFEL